jgi:hypothetical protein
MNIWPPCEFAEISFSLIFRYFNTLQQALEGYDCVLYEMVTSRDNLNNPNGPMAAKKMKVSHRGFSILGFIQKQMARILSLDYLLDCLDYGNKKWLHADLDYETFKQLQVTTFSFLSHQCFFKYLLTVCTFFKKHYLLTVISWKECYMQKMHSSAVSFYRFESMQCFPYHTISTY